MKYSIRTLLTLKKDRILYNPSVNTVLKRAYHGIPFLDFYEKTTGQTVTTDYLEIWKKRHPHIDKLTHDQIQCTLQILRKFNITPNEACENKHVFSMNPISVDNYGEILKECKFINIDAKHIIRYHTLVKSRTIAKLKKDSLLPDNVELERVLLKQFLDWPTNSKTLLNFSDHKTNILTVRMSVLERYLHWRLSVTSEEFQKYCRNYLPLKHKPMADIIDALDLAKKDIKLNDDTIKRNGFIISSDPINTKLILENVASIAGLDIRQVIRIEPAVLKNNYNALLQIRNILEEYRISEEAQRNCLKVYCMNPNSVKERLDELGAMKEFRLLSTNPRVLSMVIHKNKMLKRLSKIEAVKKQCYSLNHLISSNKVFNNYINSFGDKVCGRDIAILIGTSLQSKSETKCINDTKKSETVQKVLKQLKRHKYWLHAALNVIDENIQSLKNRFDEDVILNNCQILLYPGIQVEQLINVLISLRSGKTKEVPHYEPYYNNIKFETLSDNQILSLVLYEIEKKYHFSGDGIWARQDGIRIDTQSAN